MIKLMHCLVSYNCKPQNCLLIKTNQIMNANIKWVLKAFDFNRVHCRLKVSRSQAKIGENFANYFLKTKANNKCFIVLNVKGYRKV